MSDESSPYWLSIKESAQPQSVGASLSLPFESTGLHGSLESDDASILLLEQSETMLVVIIDDTTEWHESPIEKGLADTDPANNICSLCNSKSVILFKGFFISSYLNARKEQKNNTITLVDSLARWTT